MATVVLRPGERVRVELHETDGAFEICYGEQELTVAADLPGSHLGIEGVIYREVFADRTCVEMRGVDEAFVDPACPEHGRFGSAHTAACG